jgi:galactose-1-phosphate uridylyltransferase
LHRALNIVNMDELRRDYFTDHWVIIAADRAKRPTDFA